MKEKEFIYVNLGPDSYNKIATNSEFRVLFALFKVSSTYKPDFVYGNEVITNLVMIDKIKEITGKCNSTIRNSITNLSRTDLLLKHPKYKAIYYLNPIYFFKGELEERELCVNACIKAGLIV